MPTKIVEVDQVIATHRHEWRKWPDTADDDYASVFAERSQWVFRRDDVELRVNNRFYPVYSAYPRSGDKRLPIRFPVIDNLYPPSEAVLAQQRNDLKALSAKCTILLWEHTHQCFPAVACDLPTLFPTLRTIQFGDDCPGSSDVKTFPVAAYFNALCYSMFVWNAETGSLTADEYQRRGLAYTRFCPSGMSAGLTEGLRDLKHDLAQKQALVRVGWADPHLGFVGFSGAGERAVLMQHLKHAHGQQKQLGLSLRLYGMGMPDGILEPRDPPHPKGLGYPMAPLYHTALSSVNVPISSLFNCRLADLFLAGVVQFVRDRWGELPRMGFVEGEHYLGFDGTADDLLRKVESLRQRPEEAAALIGRAHAKAVDFWRENSWSAAFGDIYFKHLVGLGDDTSPLGGIDGDDGLTFVAGCRR